MAVAALLFAAAVGLSGESIVDYSSWAYVALDLLAFVPQLIGYTAMHRSLDSRQAAPVAIAIVAEP